MFEIGWSELLIVAVVALVVVGPKDLPVLLRTIGHYVGDAKRLMGSLRTQFDDAVREADVDLVRKELEAVKAAAEMENSRSRGAAAKTEQALDRPSAG